MQGEVASAKVLLAPPFTSHKYHLFCSEFNAGALALAQELSNSDVFTPKSAALSYTEEVAELNACNHMLLLLDERTWTSGEDTAQFVEHVHCAMRTGLHICCAHESPSVVGPLRHACDFDRMVRIASPCCSPRTLIALFVCLCSSSMSGRRRI